MDRRALLAGLALTAVAGPALAQPAPGAVDTGPIGETVEVGPGCFAYIQRQPPGFSNLSISDAGWIEGNDEVLLVDTLAAPMHALALKAAIAKRTSKPIRRIVITHHHGDHTGGLPYFMPADVIAHVGARELIAGAGPNKPNSWRKRLGWATGDETWPGLILPNVTFDKGMVLWGFGDGPVEVFNPGPAHTAGDAIVRVPAAKVAYLGDNGFFKTTPMAHQSYVTELIAFLDDMLTWDVDKFVPGHGPVGTKADVADNRDYFVLVKAAARKGFDRGWTPGRTAAEADLGRFRGWPDEDRVALNVNRLYLEFRGELKPAVDMAQTRPAVDEYRRLKGLPPLPPPAPQPR